MNNTETLPYDADEAEAADAKERADQDAALVAWNELTAGPPDLGDCRFHYYGFKYCDRPAVEVLENNHALRFCAEHAAAYRESATR